VAKIYGWCGAESRGVRQCFVGGAGLAGDGLSGNEGIEALLKLGLADDPILSTWRTTARLFKRFGNVSVRRTDPDGSPLGSSQVFS